MKVNIGGSWKPVTSAKINIGGTLKTVSRVRHNVAGTFKDGASFYVALTASADQPTVSRITNGSPVVTGSRFVTPAGGYAPYTYAWVRISGSGTALYPASSATNFSAVVAAYESITGTFRCTVTDSHGATATADVTATFTNLGP